MAVRSLRSCGSLIKIMYIFTTFATQYDLHCITASSQTADFNNAFMNAMGVQPLLECSYSKVGNLVGAPLLYVIECALCTSIQ